MRLGVHDPSRREQPLHLAAVGGERPPAIGRQLRQHDVDRHVEPDRQAVQIDRAAVFGLDEGAAARGHDDVAQRQEDLENLSFHGAEVRLAGAGEDVRDGPALARFDQLVDILRAPAETGRECAGDGRFAGRHETHEIDLVCRHRVSRSSASKNPGYETLTDDAPRIVVG